MTYIVAIMRKDKDAPDIYEVESFENDVQVLSSGTLGVCNYRHYGTAGKFNRQWLYAPGIWEEVRIDAEEDEEL